MLITVITVLGIFIFVGILATVFNTVTDTICPPREELNETENWYGLNEGEIW